MADLLPGGDTRIRLGDATHELNLAKLLEKELADERKRLKTFQSELAALREKALKRVYIPLRDVVQRNHPNVHPESYLEVIGGWQSGQRFKVPTGRVQVIGRDENADLILRDTGISRAHCKVENVDDWRYQLRDLGSHNGTRLNGDRIERTEIEHGDLVWLGLTFLFFSHSLAALASRLGEHSFLKPEALQNVLRFEDTIHHIQIGIARISYELWMLDHADRKKHKPTEMALKVHTFKENASKILKDLEDEHSKADSLLQRVMMVPSTIRVDGYSALPGHKPDHGPQAAIDGVLRNLVSLRSEIADIEYKHRRALRFISRQVDLLKKLGHEKEADDLEKRLRELTPGEAHGSVSH